MIRRELRALYKEREDVNKRIQSITTKYISSLSGSKGIFITDHAIVRYLERVKGITFTNTNNTDAENLALFPGSIKELRDEILTLEEDREILKKQLGSLKKGDHIYIIKELALVTILNFI